MHDLYLPRFYVRALRIIWKRTRMSGVNTQYQQRDPTHSSPQSTNQPATISLYPSINRDRSINLDRLCGNVWYAVHALYSDRAVWVCVLCGSAAVFGPFYRTHAYVYRDRDRDRDHHRTSVLCVANELGLDSLGVDINQRCVEHTYVVDQNAWRLTSAG